MTSVSFAIVGSGIKTGLKETAKAKAKGQIMSALPADKGKLADAAATLVSSAIDGVYDMALKGDVKGSTLAIALLKNSAAIAGLSNDEKLECASALLALAGDGMSFGAQVGVVTAAEFATAGLATPVVVIQAGLLAKTGFDVVNSSIKANQQCGPLAMQGYSYLEANWSELSLEVNWSELVRSLEVSVTDAVMNQPIP
jgi:hypothetical protein